MKSIQRIFLAGMIGLTIMSCNEQEELQDLTGQPSSPLRTGDFAYIAGVPSPYNNLIKKANPTNGSNTVTAISEAFTVKTVAVDLNNIVYYTFEDGSDVYITSSQGTWFYQLLDNLGAAFNPEEIEWINSTPNSRMFAIKPGDHYLYEITNYNNSSIAVSKYSNLLFTGQTKGIKKSLCRSGSNLKMVTGSSNGGSSITLWDVNVTSGVATSTNSLSLPTGHSFTTNANINSYYAGSTLYVAINDNGAHSLYVQTSSTTLGTTSSPGAFGSLGTDCSWMPMP